jgi:S-adenosylmethionine:tRNA ribosyltransferase-isomerase
LKIVDGLVSNFQSPGISTLVMAAAFVGRKTVLSLYDIALRRGYKFLEWGDAVFYDLRPNPPAIINDIEKEVL